MAKPLPLSSGAFVLGVFVEGGQTNERTPNTQRRKHDQSAIILPWQAEMDKYRRAAAPFLCRTNGIIDRKSNK